MSNDGKTVVLVADDEPSTRALVAGHLRNKGYKVIEASDGDEAWELAHEHLPHLVVLDVMMPGMSGWEVCRKIREAVSLAHTGIVMLTGIGENLNEMTSPLYGADAYIDKPFEFSILDDKINETLARRHGGAIGRGDGATELAPVNDRTRPETEPSDVPVKSSDVRRAAARKRATAARKAATRASIASPVEDAPTRNAAGDKTTAAKKTTRKIAKTTAAKKTTRKIAKTTAAKKTTRKIAKTTARVTKKARKAKTAKTAKTTARQTKTTARTVKRTTKKTPRKAKKAAGKIPARRATKKIARKVAKKAPRTVRRAKKRARKA